MKKIPGEFIGDNFHNLRVNRGPDSNYASHKEKLLFCSCIEHTPHMWLTIILRQMYSNRQRKKRVTIYSIIIMWGYLKIQLLLKD